MATLLHWRGDEVAKRVRAAALAAVDETTEAAAEDARANHWWANRSGSLEGNIVVEPAKADAGGRVAGRFGTSLRREAFYGLFLERKTPFLRPAADREFPQLAKRIRGRLSRLDRFLGGTG